MRLLPVILAAALLAPDASAQLRLTRLLGDGAVVQRDAPITVWGWAAPGADVVVTFGDDRARATADAAGRWRTTLPARPAGGPFRLGAEAGGARVEAEDVLVGDVWLASGQSNMEWPVNASDGADATIASTGDARIRHFKVPRSYAETAQDTLAGGAWEAAAPATVADFSAVAYAFARAIRAHHDVPIGIVDATWGGSRIEPWMSPAMLDLDAEAVADVFADEAARRADAEARAEATAAATPGALAPTDDDPATWHTADHDDASWARLAVPARWEAAGFDGLDGIAWYRTSFDLSAPEAAAGVALGLGRIDDSDRTFVNGTPVGGVENGWEVDRRYAVPASVLRAGENAIAVRVTDIGWAGGMAGEPDSVYVETADGTRRSLAGPWRFRIEAVQVDPTTGQNQVPTALWNAMVHPALPARIAGVIWYQGESNAGTEADARAYADVFPALIEGWRAAFETPDLPFLWVQLAAFEATGHWPTLRASQSAALRLPHTAEVVTLDVGDPADIHPRDKETVGRRLALAARAVAYGEDTPASGPRYRDHAVRDGRVEVAFDHVDGGLGTRGGLPLGGFEVADADGDWHDANARLEGDRVVVWSDAVPAPTAARYAWTDFPEAATLQSAEGLPAAPFRTE